MPQKGTYEFLHKASIFRQPHTYIHNFLFIFRQPPESSVVMKDLKSYWPLQRDKEYTEKKREYCKHNHVLFCTDETITVTSSSLPPVYPPYPAALAASANGLLVDDDRPTSCALMANSSAISWKKTQANS